jgi:transposase
MLSLSTSIRIFVHIQPTDMRKQFNGLHAIVTHSLGQDVMAGDYFVFFNRRQHRCKILYWDRDGLVVWAKRLERGRFQIPAAEENAITVEIDGTTLFMILGGVDLQSVHRRKRYQVPPRPCTTVDSNDAKDAVRHLPNRLPATA